ncbi:Dor1 family protein [Ceratobasidium theobromae]|uniref:Conserved oligomeric Golgi complex subunit 8 n=1 Tax=Ceratobasidium theobromae TaxID=1582974 RepID=A0A5N5QTK6_9AGAM|nr:Dor1 family protein [Ceratobasidium theobromae]
MATTLDPPVTLGSDNSGTNFASLPELLSQVAGHDLSQPGAQSYLRHLSALELTSIRLEPSALASESSQLRTELTNLCHDQHSTFLTVHSTSRDLNLSLGSLDESLGKLLTALPDLESQCRAFAVSTREIQLSRSRASLVLEQHDKLLDVLTIPQLIDMCSRNGHYAEALDLSAHAATLASRFPDIQVICDVAAEADTCVRGIRATLLMTLREPTKLPALAKAVALLRRMKSLEENELALAFLTGRVAHLNASLKAIEREGSDQFEETSRYLKRYIDVFRENLHEIVTQFSTIFLERASIEEVQHGPIPIVELHNYLLGEVAHHVVEILHTVLSFSLAHISDPSALNALLSQLSYCGSAFARIGLDFRSMLPELFEQAVLAGVTRTLDQGTAAFSQRIQQMQRSQKLPALWLVTPEQAGDPPMALRAVPEALSHLPPTMLSSYPPIAALANVYITALNQLRLLAPANILPQIYDLYCASLAGSSSDLLVYSKHVVASEKTKPRRTSIDGEDEQNRAVLAGAGLAISRTLSQFVLSGLVQGVYAKSVDEWDPPRTGGVLSLQEAEKNWENWLAEMGLRSPGAKGEVLEGDVGA